MFSLQVVVKSDRNYPDHYLDGRKITKMVDMQHAKTAKAAVIIVTGFSYKIQFKNLDIQ